MNERLESRTTLQPTNNQCTIQVKVRNNKTKEIKKNDTWFETKEFCFFFFCHFSHSRIDEKKILILWMGVIVVKFFGKFDLIHDDHDDDGTN